jgi:uracil-DNA glycosylase family 4
VSDGRALARAYLEQQRLLGTDAVALPSVVGALPRGAAAASADAAPPEREPQPGPAAGAPLPPSGLDYEPPSGDLFSTDPVRQASTLAEIAALVAPCTKCKLCDSRTHTVPGEGPDAARLAVVGEGPGRTEDETGRPFVGQAGDLLTKILAAIELSREEVFICNVVKCRPPQNRTPAYDEIAACVPYLFRQLEILRPAVILAMGNTAAQTLLNAKQSLGSMRGKIHHFRGTPVIVTYHPAALLRNPNWKKPTWDDVRIAQRLLAR